MKTVLKNLLPITSSLYLQKTLWDCTIDLAMMHGLEGLLIYREFFDYLFLTVLFIKLQNIMLQFFIATKTTVELHDLAM